MNPACYICDNVASYACRHKECQIQPYFCKSTKCRKIVQGLHQHQGERNFVLLIDLKIRIRQIEEGTGSSIHQQHIQNIRKQGIILKQTLENKIQEHIADLQKSLALELVEEVEWTLDDFSKNNRSIKGKDISYLFENNRIYIDEVYIKEASKSIKQQFIDNLNKMNDILNSVLSYDARLQKIEKVLQQSKYFKSAFRSKRCLDYLNNFSSICDFNYEYQILSAKCYKILNQNNKYMTHIERAVQLKPDDSQSLFALGKLKMENQQFQKAITYFNKVLQFHQSEEYYQQRYQCFLKMKRFKQAATDCQKMIVLNPCQQNYEKIIKVYQSLSKNQLPIQYYKDLKQQISEISKNKQSIFGEKNNNQSENDSFLQSEWINQPQIEDRHQDGCSWV